MRIRHRAVSIGLGRAIDIAELRGTQRLDRHRDVSGRADGEPGSHRPQAPLGVIRVRQQGSRHIRHAVVDAAALAFDQRQRLPGLEALLQHDTAAMAQGGRQGVGGAERPEQRHREPDAIRCTQMHALTDVKSVGDDAAMGERYALGRRGRARGIEDVANVVRPHRPLGSSKRCRIYQRSSRQEFGQRKDTGRRLTVDRHYSAQRREPRALQRPGLRVAELRTQNAQRVEKAPAAKRVERDHCHGTAVFQRPGKLARRRKRADRSDDGTDLRGGEAANDPFRPVRRQ